MKRFCFAVVVLTLACAGWANADDPMEVVLADPSFLTEELFPDLFHKEIEPQLPFELSNIEIPGTGRRKIASATFGNCHWKVYADLRQVQINTGVDAQTLAIGFEERADGNYAVINVRLPLTLRTRFRLDAKNDCLFTPNQHAIWNVRVENFNFSAAAKLEVVDGKIQVGMSGGDLALSLDDVTLDRVGGSLLVALLDEILDRLNVIDIDEYIAKEIKKRVSSNDATEMLRGVLVSNLESALNKALAAAEGLPDLPEGDLLPGDLRVRLGGGVGFEWDMNFNPPGAAACAEKLSRMPLIGGKTDHNEAGDLGLIIPYNTIANAAYVRFKQGLGCGSITIPYPCENPDFTDIEDLCVAQGLDTEENCRDLRNRLFQRPIPARALYTYDGALEVGKQNDSNLYLEVPSAIIIEVAGVKLMKLKGKFTAPGALSEGVNRRAVFDVDFSNSNLSDIEGLEWLRIATCGEEPTGLSTSLAATLRGLLGEMSYEVSPALSLPGDGYSLTMNQDYLDLTEGSAYLGFDFGCGPDGCCNTLEREPKCDLGAYDAEAAMCYHETRPSCWAQVIPDMFPTPGRGRQPNIVDGCVNNNPGNSFRRRMSCPLGTYVAQRGFDFCRREFEPWYLYSNPACAN